MWNVMEFMSLAQNIFFFGIFVTHARVVLGRGAHPLNLDSPSQMTFPLLPYSAHPCVYSIAIQIANLCEHFHLFSY